MIAPNDPPPPTAPDTSPVIWMTCAFDSHEHAVTDHHFAAGTRRGYYQAACGHLVAPRALTSPPGRRCRTCLGRVDQRPTVAAARSRWARARRALASTVRASARKLTGPAA